ncbi:MAG: aminotransferase class III-fold pyridoxal phosphate-dependent enzyme, partial [Chloroflexi bacterium]|nr:aminotransferase class III-fold pyridoxal phosphate-dependent enzyme [Chloroflexota bacterium]
LLDRLATLRNEHPIVADVRGLGLMIGVEFQTGEQAAAVAEACFRRGLIVLGCGDKAIRFSPPLVVSREEVDVALQVFEAAIAGVENG